MNSAALGGRIVAARVGPAPVARIYGSGGLVTWNGYTGKVSGYTASGLVVVAFGAGKRREINESELQVFVPWWSDRD